MIESPNGPRSGGPISLEQLIALNDELVALVRAGLPLERGLRDAGRDLGGRLGEATEALATRLARGEDLVGALEAEGDRYPKVYRAVVAAGLRSGRLSVALEGLAAYARGYVEMRRAIGLAMIYPALVMAIAYGLMVWMVLTVVPRFVSAFETLGPRFRLGPFVWIERIGNSAAYWAPILPAAMLLGWFVFATTGRSATLRGGWVAGLLRRVPWIGRMLEQSRSSSFAEMLGLLVEQGVPLDEGIRLAADAAGDEPLKRSSAVLSDALRRGEPPSEALRGVGAFPPLVRWLLTTGRGRSDLVAGLKTAAETYRRRAMRQAALLRLVLPNVLLIGLGAGATLIYALIVFGPLAVLLRDLTKG